MKKAILFAAAILALAACKKSIAFEDVLYFTGTESSPETSLYVDGPTDASFTVTSSSAVGKDVKVTVAIDPAAFTVVGADGVRRSGSGTWTLWAGFGQPDARTEELAGQKCLSVIIREG